MVYKVIQYIWCKLHEFNVLEMNDLAIFSMSKSAICAKFK